MDCSPLRCGRSACLATLVATLFTANSSPAQAQAQAQAARPDGHWQAHLNPLPGRNQFPLAQIFGLGNWQTSLNADRASWAVRLRHTAANTYIEEESSGGTALLAGLFDGEVNTSELEWVWQPSPDWQFTTTLPYVAHGKGHLDSLITKWHDWFKLPDGGRREDTNGQFQYLINEESSEPELNFTTPSESIGDLRLLFAYQLEQGASIWLPQLSLKLPTGRGKRLTGSGGTDLGIALGWRTNPALGQAPFAPFATVGAVWLEKGDHDLADKQKSWAVTGQIGSHWHLNTRFSLTAQLETHSPLYRSSLRALSATPLQLTVGGSFMVAQNWRWEVAVSEDLRTFITPDIAIATTLEYRPGSG